MIAATSGLAYGGFLSNFVIDVSGVEFWDTLGSPNNDTISIISDIEGAWITNISWDVNLTTVTAPSASFPSWASEATISFNDLALNVGAGDDFGVVNQNYFGSTDVDITMGLGELLNLEFWESFDDAENQVDAFFGAGSTITFSGSLLFLRVVPGSSTLIPLVMGGLVFSRRCR